MGYCLTKDEIAKVLSLYMDFSEKLAKKNIKTSIDIMSDYDDDEIKFHYIASAFNVGLNKHLCFEFSGFSALCSTKLTDKDIDKIFKEFNEVN